MLTKFLLLATVLVAAVCFPTTAYYQSADGSRSKAPEASWSPSPVAWPNLDKLKNPDGRWCGLDGSSGGDPERAAQNRLRNRYHLPAGGFEQLSLNDLQTKLPQGEISPNQTLINYPRSTDPNNQRAVSVVGYVVDVLVLGCGAANELVVQVPLPDRQGVEAAICYVNRDHLCTTQITVSSNPNLPRDLGRNVFFVNVTRRTRILARRNLLVSNIGNDWSTAMLREKLKGWVRFSGWLFFNQNYRERAWVTDPENKIGKPNDRQTAWGIHPVLAIEVDGAPPL